MNSHISNWIFHLHTLFAVKVLFCNSLKCSYFYWELLFLERYPSVWFLPLIRLGKSIESRFAESFAPSLSLSLSFSQSFSQDLVWYILSLANHWIFEINSIRYRFYFDPFYFLNFQLTNFIHNFMQSLFTVIFIIIQMQHIFLDLTVHTQLFRNNHLHFWPAPLLHLFCFFQYLTFFLSLSFSLLLFFHLASSIHSLWFSVFTWFNDKNKYN